MDCEVGLADKENSELLPPLPEPPTVRRGEITQPFAMKNSAANSSANLRMNPLFRRRSRMIRFCPRIFSPVIFAPTLCSGTKFVPNLFVLKQGGAPKQKDNFIGFPGAAQMFAG